jgi:hypothetical protein
MLLVSKFSSGRTIRQQHGYVVVREAGFLEPIDYMDRLIFGLRDTENCFCHHRLLRERVAVNILPACDFKLVVDVAIASYALCFGQYLRLFLLRLDGAAQRHRTIDRDDLDILGFGGKAIVFHQSSAD